MPDRYIIFVSSHDALCSPKLSVTSTPPRKYFFNISLILPNELLFRTDQTSTISPGKIEVISTASILLKK
jgi:hypothetical protein